MDADDDDVGMENISRSFRQRRKSSGSISLGLSSLGNAWSQSFRAISKPISNVDSTGSNSAIPAKSTVSTSNRESNGEDPQHSDAKRDLETGGVKKGEEVVAEGVVED